MNAADEQSVYEALRQIIDPELGCNIVDLGFIYSVELRNEKLRVAMTLSTPGCPMSQHLVQGVEYVLQQIPGIQSVEVELVWDPPWNPAMMNEAGRQEMSRRG